MQTAQEKTLTVRLATGPDDLRAAQALRYQVFVEELGGNGPLVDHAAKLERDAFDPHCDHLLLLDGTKVVGVYRLMDAAQAAAAGGFYSEAEYDLAPLRDSGRPLLELGRSCLDPAYRGGEGLMRLWQGLAAELARRNAEVLFGVASFPGTDPKSHAAALSLLHYEHRAPDALCPRSRAHAAMDLVTADALDRKAALRAMPTLIKAYLRLGGQVGDGAFVDHRFNTIDVCMIFDVTRIGARQKALYLGQGRS